MKLTDSGSGNPHVTQREAPTEGRGPAQRLTPEQVAALERGAAVSEWDREQGERYLVKLMLAVNDPDNGDFSGQVRAVEVVDRRGGDIYIGLESSFWDWAPPCRLWPEGELQIGRRRFPILGHLSWVGNWCWDLVIVTAWTAARIFNWLRLQGYWSIDVGEHSMFEKWQRAEPYKWGDFSAPGVGRWVKGCTSTSGTSGPGRISGARSAAR